MNLPIISYSHVYHAGDLNKPRPTEASDSYEGSCMSVSLCPNDWIYIAKLDAPNIYTLSKEDGYSFLDIHEVKKRDILMNSIIEWSIEQGFIVQATRWIGWTYDVEVEDWSFGTYMTREEAEYEVAEEVENRVEDGEPVAPEGHEVVEASVIWVATSRLAERMRQHGYGVNDALDFAIIAWAEDTQTKLDGVWWYDSYDPESLTAPRGGLFQRSASESVKLEVLADEWYDYEEEVER